MSKQSLRPQASQKSSRRAFLKNSTAAAVGGALAGSLTTTRMVHAAGGDTLKVALIGCGGRGSGAAVNAMRAESNVKLTVMADLFPDHLDSSRNSLRPILKQQFAVSDDNCFTGFDAYKEVMKTDVDVVLLCTPPGFRPSHLKAAIDAGKHVFCEKPVAVDGPGCRSVFETVEQARQKKLSIVSGLCWRYDQGVRETIKRIQDGAIGEITAIQENYLTGPISHHGRDPKWSELEYQLRNWYFFTWLSGDHNVEQHVHSLDKALWLMGDQPPLECFGMGGRQVRTDAKWGHIFDHHAVCYDYPNGVKVFSYTRQMPGCYNNVDDYILGTKGSAQILKFSIQGENAWQFRGSKPSMYDVEHKELFAGIRSGNVINDGVYMTRSTLMAIMGRMACYTGQKITWDQAMNSQEDLSPPKLQWGDAVTPPVAMPGITKFV